MNKKILIINEYAGSPRYGMTFRHYYLAKEFINKGYKTTIITASYSHFLKKFPNMQNSSYKNENIDGVDYLWVKVMKYSKSFDKKRALKWFEFAYKLFFVTKYLDEKPDIIICSTTAPFAIIPAYYLSKKFNAKLVFEVRDIWPMTLVEIGGFSKNNLFIKFMGLFEKFALKKSDILVSNLQNYTEHVKELGINREANWVSNGIFLQEMKNIKKLDVSISDLIPKNRFIIGYTGKLGISNAITYLIEAAEILAKHSDIYFVIVGDGQEKENLIKKAEALSNVIFIDSIEKLEIHSMLELFDVCYIGLQKEKLFKYGVSPNKLYDYMYSAKPILHSIDTSNNIVGLSNCGISVEAENSKEIATAILKFYNMDKTERDNFGGNAKSYVLEHFTYDKLAEKFIRILNCEIYK
ncbi:Glycosyl transferase, group 1 [Sulfurimonas denitrificans DSM 1251]|jgi:glycosyltransferase involved in cell wall biosynthesis|uniref:Glycosyl transferase, group 1 n=1 Tax=Sulfurimonas denitrificans (strain ATCC 33889 / DSM 1251) TaxID=326298 RepID=Q30QN7_SULDN|nr:glycosyltransferase [Sulfurimonas denitrificans]ABB44694.1 Glycosyl transferase, group 1 [Sulfurimonas denitrificans DSM 1251]MDD3442828.1 glycosyltransferase family 4 protein [Sulfurimonas denitrificans]